MWAAVIGILGVLQAWDSGVFVAGTSVILLAMAGIAAPVAAFLLSPSYPAHWLSIAVMLVLLTCARMVSPISLNGLHITIVPASFLALAMGLKHLQRAQPDSASRTSR
jgi:hypothetical protein